MKVVSPQQNSSHMTQLYLPVKRLIRPLCTTVCFSLCSALLPAQTAPVFDWSGSIDGTDQELVTAVGSDFQFNVFSAGTFAGTHDFDPGPGVAQLSALPSVADQFVVKYRSNGTFAWAKDFDASSGIVPNAIAGDNNGNVIIAGEFYGTVDFNPGPGTMNISANGNPSDGYLCQLDSLGNLNWAFAISSAGQEYIKDIVVDSVGNIYCVGNFQNTIDFDPGPGNTSLSPSLTAEGTFVAKYSAAGALLWAGQIENQPGGSGIGFSLHINNAGDVLLGGEFWGQVDFDLGAGIHLATASGFNSESYVLQFTPAGTFSQLITFGGSSSNDFINDITTDENGTIYCSGCFNGTVDLAPGTQIVNHVTGGSYDVYLVAISSTGNYMWSNTFGNTFDSGETNLVYSQASGLHLTGFFAGNLDFDPGPGSFNMAGASPSEAFYARYTASGSFITATELGDWCYDLQTDKFGALYFGGQYSSFSNLDPITSTVPISPVGYADGYTVKLCAANQTNEDYYFCPGDSVFVYGSWYQQPASWTDTYVGVNGCDSIVNVLVQEYVPFVLFQPLSQDTFCTTGGLFVLNTGFPAAGTYSGPGVTDTIFNPAVAGAGVHDLYYTFTYPNGCTGYDTLTVVVEICLDVAEASNNALHVYPQPATDFLYIGSPEKINASVLSLYSLQGQQLEVKTMRTGNQLQLDLRSVAPGVYLLRMESEGKPVTCRVVKQ